MSAELRGLPLLDAVIEQIEAHPETWNQGDWRCESGKCVAGWAAELGGGRWLVPEGQPGESYLVPEPDDPPGDVWDVRACGLLTGVNGVPVYLRAARLLGLHSSWMSDQPGLSSDDERDLFSAANDLDDIKGMRDDLRAAAIDRAEEEARP